MEQRALAITWLNLRTLSSDACLIVIDDAGRALMHFTLKFLIDCLEPSQCFSLGFDTSNFLLGLLETSHSFL